jgi:hypothetical protein
LHIEPLHLPPEESRAMNSTSTATSITLNSNSNLNINSANVNSVNNNSIINNNINSSLNSQVSSVNTNQNLLINDSNNAVYKSTSQNILKIHDDFEDDLLNKKHSSSCSTHHAHSNVNYNENNGSKPKKMTPLAVSLAALKASRLEKNKQAAIDSSLNSSVENKIDW